MLALLILSALCVSVVVQEGGMAFRANLADQNLATVVSPMIVHEAMETKTKAAKMSHAVISVRDCRQYTALLGWVAVSADGALGLLLFWRRLDEAFGVR